MIKLSKGILVVKGEDTDTYKVEFNHMREDLIAVFNLIPNKRMREDGVQSVDYFTIDVLNETIIEALKNEGYYMIKSEYWD